MKQGGYPIGATDDPNAPYNEKEPEMQTLEFVLTANNTRDIEIELPKNFDNYIDYDAALESYFSNHYCMDRILWFARQAAYAMLNNGDYSILPKNRLEEMVKDIEAWDDGDEIIDIKQ